MCQLELIGAFWTHVANFLRWTCLVVAIVGNLEVNLEAGDVSIAGNEKWLPFAWVLGVKKRPSG
jgi:hypothetical protein